MVENSHHLIVFFWILTFSVLLFYDKSRAYVSIHNPNVKIQCLSFNIAVVINPKFIIMIFICLFNIWHSSYFYHYLAFGLVILPPLFDYNWSPAGVAADPGYRFSANNKTQTVQRKKMSTFEDERGIFGWIPHDTIIDITIFNWIHKFIWLLRITYYNNVLYCFHNRDTKMQQYYHLYFNIELLIVL